MTEELNGTDTNNNQELELPPPPPPIRGDLNDEDRGDGDVNTLDEDFVQLDDINDYDDEEEDDNDDKDDDDDQDDSDYNGNVKLTSGMNGSSSASSQQLQQQQQQLPPWMDRPHPVFANGYHYNNPSTINPLVALHNEVVSFCRLMEPRPNEMKQRQDLVDRFTKLAQSVFGGGDGDNARGGCKVEVFGSQLTELCLPSSDIDIAIQLDNNNHTGDSKEGEGNNKNNNNNKAKQAKTEKQQELEDMKNWDKPTGTPLQRLGDALRSEWIDELSYLELIENTRVPLVKFTHEPTGISVDVCFNQTTGPQAAALVHSYMRALPPLRPLTFLLKSFLASRGLNQPYTGGIGSFMLQMMIVSFLQHRERDSLNSQRPSFPNLGALLVEFFEFFSTDFNFITTGISVRYDGFFFPKGATDRKEDFWNPTRPFCLALENPLDPTMDVGSASFRMQGIQRSFELAFKVLLAHVSEPLVPTVSILEKILPVTDEMNQRRLTAGSKSIDVDAGGPSRKKQKR